MIGNILSSTPPPPPIKKREKSFHTIMNFFFIYPQKEAFAPTHKMKQLFSHSKGNDRTHCLLIFTNHCQTIIKQRRTYICGKNYQINNESQSVFLFHLPTPNSSRSCSTALAFLIPTDPGIFI